MTTAQLDEFMCPMCEGTGHYLTREKEFGGQMRSLRHSAGLTLREVGSRLHYSEAYCSDLELGKRHWSMSLARRYEAALTT